MKVQIFPINYWLWKLNSLFVFPFPSLFSLCDFILICICVPSFQFQYFRSTVYTTSRLSFNNSCSTFSRFFSLTCYYFLQSLSQTLLSFFFFVLVTHNKHRWYYFPKDRKLFFYYVIFSWSSDFDQYFYLSSHPFFIFFFFLFQFKTNVLEISCQQSYKNNPPIRYFFFTWAAEDFSLRQQKFSHKLGINNSTQKEVILESIQGKPSSS